MLKKPFQVRRRVLAPVAASDSFDYLEAPAKEEPPPPPPPKVPETRVGEVRTRKQWLALQEEFNQTVVWEQWLVTLSTLLVEPKLATRKIVDGKARWVRLAPSCITEHIIAEDRISSLDIRLSVPLSVIRRRLIESPTQILMDLPEYATPLVVRREVDDLGIALVFSAVKHYSPTTLKDA